MAILSWRILAVPAALLLLSTIYRVIHSRFISPLRKYPGPFLWSISIIPHTYSHLTGHLHTDTLKLHQQYGPVVRVGPTRLCFATETAWRDAWGHRQGHEEFFKDVRISSKDAVPGILAANRQNHARYRRLLSHAFSERGMREQEPKFGYYIDLLMQRLKEHSPEGPQDMVSWYNWTTFDVIGDLAFGESFGCLENSRLHPWVADIFNSLAAIIFIRAVRDFGLTLLLKFLTPKRFYQGRQENRRFTAEKIERRVALGKDRGDFLDNIVKRDVDEGGMTLEELKANASTLVLAGSETTATLLSGATFELLRNPRVLSKLQDEIRKSFSGEREITMESTARLKYLHATLEEAMRTYPPVPTFAGRVVPYPGDTIDGDYLPGGTACEIVQYAAFNWEGNFKRPSEFIPERWLGDPEFAGDNRAVHMPFAHGPRNCIGKNLAYAEMKLIMAKIIWNFDISAAPETDMDWIKYQRTFILWEKSPLMVNLKLREP